MKNKHKLLIILIFLIIVDAFVFLSQRRTITGLTPGTQATATVSFTIVSACSIPLSEGWNFVSFCANLTNKSLTKNLEEINSSYRYVLEWNESRQGFDIYSPLSAEKPFETLNENKSYFIYFMESEHHLNIIGNLYNDTAILLIYGWNSPIYPYEFTTNMTKYLNTIAGQFRYVLKWNTTLQEFDIFSPLSAEKPFEFINMGEGQFLYINDTLGATLVYNRSALQ